MGDGVRRSAKLLQKKVGLEGFEPLPYALGNRCSIRLSYRSVPSYLGENGVRNM
jgi:hypothetical protein